MVIVVIKNSMLKWQKKASCIRQNLFEEILGQ